MCEQPGCGLQESCAATTKVNPCWPPCPPSRLRLSTADAGPSRCSCCCPADPGPINEDPAPYEAELQAREATFGPSHPDVAESLSNLAILYNQRGDYAKAQPLYERALAIWEKTQGPDNPDVAHTLTDLAVLHLEQVSSTGSWAVGGCMRPAPGGTWLCCLWSR